MKMYLRVTLIFYCLFYLFSVVSAKDIEIVTSLENENRVLNEPIDLHLSDASNPLLNSTIDIVSEEAWLFFDNVKPSIVMDEYSSFIKINGETMNPYTDANCRIVVYKQGAVIIPHPASYRPLETFTDLNFSGNAQKYIVDQYYTNSPITQIPVERVEELKYDNSIRSFKLKRGYMATFANEPDGMGYSRCFIADAEDLIISQLPEELDGKVSFIRVFPWEWVSKKGWAGTFDDFQGEGLKYVDQQCDITNSTWYYTWGSSVYGSSNATTTTLLNQEFVPEKWGKGGNTGSFYRNKRWAHLIGQNEPDHVEQSDVTVEEAVAEWPILLKTGARLGSPATTDFNWLYKFMDQCADKNYRVDYVVVHAYWGGKSPSNWYNDLKRIHERTGRPIWLKEWNNGANWTNERWPDGTRGNHPYTPANAEKQLNDLTGILQVLDTASFIERYSIYNWVEDARAILLNGELTLAGEYYASTTPPVAFNRAKEVVPTWSMIAPQLSYSFSQETGQVNLIWDDLNGELTNNYVIEQSFDNNNWQEVGEVNSSFTNNFLVDVLPIDQVPSGEVYYRIRILGFDNTSKTSNVIKYDYIKNVNNALITVEDIKVKDDWSMSLFENPVEDLVFITGTPTFRNRYPLTVRARNVNEKSVEMQLRTWSYLEDPTFMYPDTLGFMAISKGLHQIGEITLLADNISKVSKAWTTITFEEPFDVIPVVFASQITGNDINASAIRIKNITKTGFDISRKYEPAKVNVFEDVSYIAATPGVATYDGKNKLEVGLTSEAIGNSFTSTAKINYTNTYINPAFFGFMQTCNDEAPATLRLKSRGGNFAEVFKEREISSSTANAAEVIGWMVVGYDDISSAITKVKSDDKDLYVFYDSYSDKIRLSNSRLMDKIQVYSLFGTKLISASAVSQLDVSTLKSGAYIVLVNGTESLKFIKP